MSDLIIADKSEIVSIADAVRSLTGTTSTMSLSEMKSNLNTTKINIDNAFTALSEKDVIVPEGSNSSALAGLIASINTKGDSGTTLDNVNFYDYDGTLLYSYTIEEARVLTALPEGPTHPGLVFDGWNWTLEKIQSLTRPMNIGAMYSTDDGTTRIYIHLEDGRTSPILGIGLNGTARINWGDGNDMDTHLTGTSLTTVIYTPVYNYSAPGDYVIQLTIDGEAQLCGEDSSNEYSCLLRYSQEADSRNIIYQNAIRNIEIGSGIVIGNSAFQSCKRLSTITISKNTKINGAFVFKDCFSLSSITLSNLCYGIGTSTFNWCSSLSSVAIPESISSIGANAFESCRSLSNITIPDSVTFVDPGIFKNCSSLLSIIIPSGIKNINNSMFCGCSSLLDVIIMSNDVSQINDYAFQHCYSLSSITIPNSVSYIGKSAFQFCYSLSNVTMPNSAITIGESAFQNCKSLSNITIPNNISTIKPFTFQFCESLSNITIPTGIKDIGQQAFNGCPLSSIIFPSSITTIGSYAFSGCEGIKYYDFTSHTTIPTLSSGVDLTLSADAKIYVPLSLADEWKTTTNWSNYADYIVGI